jgi:capsular polysaccharide export protein
LERKRTILFLQGPTSSFWRELAKAFEAKGHLALKINLSLGDQWYWRRPGSWNYRGRFKKWKRYLTAFIKTQSVTDIIYCADRFPYHVVAAEVAHELGVTTFVIENGYLRPDWITLEREGMSAYSHFPSDPNKILQIATNVKEPDLVPRFSHGDFYEGFNEGFYHLTNFFDLTNFPFYRADKYYNRFFEYLSILLRWSRVKANNRHASAVISDLLASKQPFHLVALQTQGDYQVRDNSPYRHIGEMIDEVLSSFALHAPDHQRLVFKIHPHDNGIEGWPRVVARIAAERGVANRIVVIDGGKLEALLAAARGTIMINSTVGIYAIRMSCPVKVLGLAIYDMPGLTHQGPLETFWATPEPVNDELSKAFVRALAGSIQVKGSFYNPDGRKAAIDEIVARIENDRVNAPDAFEASPPRLTRARELVI